MDRSSNPAHCSPTPRPMARQVADAAALARALAHPARLLVLSRLVQGESSIAELQPVCGVSTSALSQHLALMHKRALVTTRAEPKTILYAAPEGPATVLLEAVYAAYCVPRD